MGRAWRPTAVLLAGVLVTAGLAGCIGDGSQEDLGATDAPGQGTDSEVFSSTDVFEGNYSTDIFRLAEVGPYEVGDQSVTLVDSELDGKDIMIYVMTPEVPEGQEVPVVADISPYFPPLQGVDLSENTYLTDVVSHGYAFALVSVRGTGDSGGCMDLMGPKERHDIDQAVTWLGTQPWSNGNVGLFGGSYDGSTQWQAASTGNPHLKTIVPLAGIPDLFSFMIHNGTAMTWTPATFYGVYWTLYGPVSYNPATGRSVEHTAEQAVCPEAAEGMSMSVVSTLTGERDPLGFWEERDWRDDILRNYTGTVYLIQGFQDTTVEPHSSLPLTQALDENGTVVKYTMGPWGHELPWRADSLEIILHWYDRWLKEDPTVDVGPKVQILDTQGNWRSSQAWPPADAERVHRYLTPEGQLASEPASSAEDQAVGPMVPVQDPAEFVGRLNAPFQPYGDPMMEVCPECPSFTLTAEDGPLRLSGTPLLDLTVTPTGPGGHVTATLDVVDGDGGRGVGVAQTDLRFPKGGETAQTVTPGEPMEVHLTFEALDVVVPEGADLVLTLHQGSYGLRAPSVPTYPVMVQTGGEASSLAFDAFEVGPGAFHEAPPRIGEGPPR